MEKLFYTRDRSLPIPIFSTVKNYTWISLNASSFDDVPSEAIDYINVSFADQPKSTTPAGHLMEMDFERAPVWYDESVHWLAHTPVGSPKGFSTSDDYLVWLFSDQEIPTMPLCHDIDVNEDGDPLQSVHGYSVESGWAVRCVELAKNLSFLVSCMVHVHPVYGHNGNTQGMGVTPPRIKEGRLMEVYESELATMDEGARGRQTVLSLLAPSFLKEYVQASDYGTHAAFERDLPSYRQWKEDPNCYDEFLQNTNAGHRGYPVYDFFLQDLYNIVDFLDYSTHPLSNKGVIRAYVERYRCIVANHREGNRTHTFLRQFPFDKDANSDRLEQPR
ncbi:hypothetical protein C8J57DRAFT_1541137 [Mycena rebaudengoi]|nr:hypothetical protein C8J57DRAFT_1541137 [Mycena rebaudengoi]